MLFACGPMMWSIIEFDHIKSRQRQQLSTISGTLPNKEPRARQLHEQALLKGSRDGPALAALRRRERGGRGAGHGERSRSQEG